MVTENADLLFTSNLILQLLLSINAKAESNPNVNYDILNTTFPNQWIPHDLPSRRDLVCDVVPQILLFGEENEKDSECACKATPIWLYQEVTDCLYIEYISALGASIVVNSCEVNRSTVYKLTHTYDEITEFPVNICDWDNQNNLRINKYGSYANSFEAFVDRLVTIDFKNNKITQIPNINCLKKLDTLVLDYNEINHISNSSFNQLTHLRELSLYSNKISTMDTTVLSGPFVHIWRVNLEANLLQEVDVTNLHSNYPFCTINLERNNIETFTNKANFSLLTNRTYGPGFVSLLGNHMQNFPNFQQLLNLKNLSALGQLMRFGFDFRQMPFDCNCHMELYFELATDFIHQMWRDYMSVKCTSPPHLKGVALVNVSLDDLICDLKDNPDCPKQCTCIDQPSKRTVLVNCSNAGKTELPPTVPHSNYSTHYNLDMSGNNITVVRNVSYLAKVSKLNLTDNNLIGIDEAAAVSLENTSMDLSENKNFHTIPKNLQFRSMCSVNMNNLRLTCDCDSSWLSSWMSVKGCNQTMTFTCDVPGHGVMPADQFSKDLLDCQQDALPLATIASILAVLIVILGVAGILVIQFRYEVLILLLKLRYIKKTAIAPSYKYDVFLSFDEENDNLRKWTIQTLVPYLHGLGYKTYVPCRDLSFGEVRESETIITLQDTKTFILLLSESYLLQEERILTDNEWRYGWNMYRNNATKKLIIINYDHVSSFDVDHPQIKAYLRVGENIQFTNHEGNIMDVIVTKLGPPCPIQAKYNDNSNKHFNCKMFQISEQNISHQKQQKRSSEETADQFNNLRPDSQNEQQSGNFELEFSGLSAATSLVKERHRPTLGQFKYYV